METLSFIKMHGIGNDFVVIDARKQRLDLSREQARAIANRHTGIGCDQLLIIENPRDEHADAFMRIFNTDGSPSEACGNGTRCVASLILSESDSRHCIIETLAGLLDCEAVGNGLVSVDMGPANLDWRDIPLSEAIDTLHLNIGSGPLQDPVGVNMGNPHAIFFVDDAEAVDLDIHGPIIEHHKLFPRRVNVEAAQIISPEHIRLRVWERGVGETLACGSGACATLVAACRRGLTERQVNIDLNGGTLQLQWMPDNHVMMTGPVTTSFSGFIDPALMA
ncbi:MAG: diaminopimelate epimerase [Rhodospirillaceae bacterium]|jgi:diaminopimelate epimerase|nr:diaminopimelate epimerase [Rhodospirillaceae bacterium]MBT5243733.1 diaminopimelate epimerase [Rhodospirillaceae bacterium]MBT5563830.1 diaminopimelate epimerase [Rhodospirillaceae bacterium]MBT6241681.1 diaminopimelate epimerase [Rhodospirillaceae bacterium]MBT7138171.1 diaminopimelate epimerase [Rhodospirillaceae bacterium]